MKDLSMIKRMGEWVRFLEMAESNVCIARVLGNSWADGSPSITSTVLEFDDRNRVINKYQVTYQYLGRGRCYLSVDGSEPVRVSADTRDVRFEWPDSQRRLAIASLKPQFDRLSTARAFMLVKMSRRGQRSYDIISSTEGTFDNLLMEVLDN